MKSRKAELCFVRFPDDGQVPPAPGTAPRTDAHLIVIRGQWVNEGWTMLKTGWRDSSRHCRAIKGTEQLIALNPMLCLPKHSLEL